MNAHIAYTLFFLLIGLIVIILLTTKYRIHAFYALVIASFVVGLGIQLPLNAVLSTIKDGFGNILKSLALIIVLGTTMGILLEHTGSTRVMANKIIKIVGERRSALAMSFTGFLVGLPIFCDSGYIVLSGLGNSLAKKTGVHIAMIAASLATGLYAVHCLIPPHPGVAAAAGIIPVDLGQLILFGIVVAAPAMITGHLWARYIGKKLQSRAEVEKEEVRVDEALPGTTTAFLPILLPILLIGLKSFFEIENSAGAFWMSLLSVVGDPVIALTIGVLLAFNCKRGWKKEVVRDLLQEAGEKAGNILLIIGAGGAFGAILGQAEIGPQLGAILPLSNIGLMFPFLIAFVMKTAQGSSTVAIITTASIVLPLLPQLGLDNESGRILSILAMGAGSMAISHANDSYFWVISKFSGLDMKTMLRVYSIATLLMGLSSMIAVYILQFFFI